MKNIDEIISAIDFFIEEKNLEYTTPVEANKYLNSIGLLKDSSSRPGLPLRELLRDDQIIHAYQIGVHWRIPHSENYRKIKTNIPTLHLDNSSSITKNKLYNIAIFIADLLYKEYKIKSEFIFEYKPNWLVTIPSNETVDKYKEIENLYSELVDNRQKLTEIIAQTSLTNNSNKQSFDIWFKEPYNFAIEFDESQHFNQFRSHTLSYYRNLKIGFSLELYKNLNKNTFIKPSSSGFTKLKSIDPLFPELLDGKSQDNRIRQRAFRDFLKDLLPIQYGFNPTIRIPYQVTNKKIKGFTEKELLNIERYLINNKILEQFVINKLK